MLKLYPLLLILAFTSCAMRIGYVGNSYPNTKKVDVFVERQAISKPYEVIGKGYLRNYIGHPAPESIQKKSVAKAMSVGADAILVEDQVLVGSTLALTQTGDSLHRVVHGGLTPTAVPNFTVLFIRYKNQ
jgi:hypothetical protein